MQCDKKLSLDYRNLAIPGKKFKTWASSVSCDQLAHEILQTSTIVLTVCCIGLLSCVGFTLRLRCYSFIPFTALRRKRSIRNQYCDGWNLRNSILNPEERNFPWVMLMSDIQPCYAWALHDCYAWANISWAENIHLPFIFPLLICMGCISLSKSTQTDIFLENAKFWEKIKRFPWKMFEIYREWVPRVIGMCMYFHLNLQYSVIKSFFLANFLVSFC